MENIVIHWQLHRTKYADKHVAVYSCFISSEILLDIRMNHWGWSSFIFSTTVLSLNEIQGYENGFGLKFEDLQLNSNSFEDWKF